MGNVSQPVDMYTLNYQSLRFDMEERKNMENASRTEDIFLNNQSLGLDRLPYISIAALFTIVGAFGNCTTIALFRNKDSKWRQKRFFIHILAWWDLLALVHLMATSVFENMYSFEYLDDILCRYFVFNSVITAEISAYLLMVIALHRYLMLCRPAGVQMNNKRKKLAVLATLLVGTVLCIPILFVSGSESTTLILFDRNFTTSPCRAYNTLSNECYFIVIFMIHSVVISTVIFLFIKIGKVVFRKTTKTNGHTPTNVNTNTDIAEEAVSCMQTSVVDLTDDEDENNLQPTAINLYDPNRRPRTKRGSTLRRNRNAKKRQARTNFTKMLIAILILNIVASIPQAVVRAWSFHDMGLKFRLDGIVLFVFLLCERSTFFIHTLDPFVFMYFDLEIRRQKVLVCHCV